jgi:hypothetical protein
MPGYRFVLDIELAECDDSHWFFDRLMDLAEDASDNIDLSCSLSPADACFPHEVTS